VSRNLASLTTPVGRTPIPTEKAMMREEAGERRSRSCRQTAGIPGNYSAESALSLSRWSPGVAILDVMLPNMNGIDLAVALKERLRSSGYSVRTAASTARSGVQSQRILNGLKRGSKPLHGPAGT
jgi:DNA-binding NarL/FixJ family response regulator